MSKRANALRGLSFLLAFALGVSSGCGSPDPNPAAEVPVHVERVALDEANIPVVVLEEQGGSRWLPIWIGTSEARSIARQMHRQTSPRPNTHDLARRLILGLEAEVARVVVTELREGTYYATMTLQVRGDTVEIDSRPSDAIAIALRADAPIFVRASLFESAGRLDPDEGGGQEIRFDPPDGKAALQPI